MSSPLPPTPQIIRSRRHEGPAAASALPCYELPGSIPMESVSSSGASNSSIQLKPAKANGGDGFQATSALVYPTKTLGYFATSALIVNRVIGSGIFDLPPIILDLVGSKGAALCMWLLGCLISWAGIIVYIEYGIRFPLTGGELYYIDFLNIGPALMMTYMYAIMFVTVVGSQGNGLAFGSTIQIAVSSSPDSPVDPNLQKLLGIGVVGLVALAQAHSGGFSVHLSNAIAAYKIILLMVLSVAGWVVIANLHSSSAKQAFGNHHGKSNLADAFSGTTTSAYNWGVALLLIQRAFHGYENANLIIEEIRRPLSDESKVFRRSAKYAILILGSLYVMTNVAFFAACTSTELYKTSDVTALFFQKVFGPSRHARRWSAILRAVSALGCVISHTYTLSRVKQEIGRMGILPLPEFWAKSTRTGAPGPALFLHFLFSSLFIAVTPLNSTNGYLIMSILSTWTRTWVAVLLGAALLFAPRLSAFRTPSLPWTARSLPHLPSSISTPLVLTLALIYTLANAFVFILSWFPTSLHRNLHTTKQILPSYVGPALGTSLSVIGAVYWLWDRKLLPKCGYRLEVASERIEGSVVHMRFIRYMDGSALKVYNFVGGGVKRVRRVFKRRREGEGMPLQREYLMGNRRRVGN